MRAHGTKHHRLRRAPHPIFTLSGRHRRDIDDSYGAAFGAAAAGEVGWHAVGAGAGASGVFGARVCRAAALPPLPRWRIQPPPVTALR